MCVIADDSGVIGLGGVMGGTSTAVSDDTTNVFIESAWFDPLRTARTGRATGILSDARYRFERGVDPESCLDGINLALKLITDYGGGDPSHARIVGHAPQRRDRVEFDHQDVKRLTGLSVKTATMKKQLKALGFAIEDSGEIWHLTVPTWRFDIDQSADIVEEIARLEGFDSLPTTLSSGPGFRPKRCDNTDTTKGAHSAPGSGGTGFSRGCDMEFHAKGPRRPVRWWRRGPDPF